MSSNETQNGGFTNDFTAAFQNKSSIGFLDFCWTHTVGCCRFFKPPDVTVLADFQAPKLQIFVSTMKLTQ